MAQQVGQEHYEAQKVGDIMTRPPRTLDVTASVMDAAILMREGDFGDVVVLEEGRLCGILTDRDIVVRVLATGDDPSSVRVGDVCSRELVTVSEGDGIGDAVRLIRAKAVRRLPVLDDDGKLVGIVSLGDLAPARDPKSALGNHDYESDQADQVKGILGDAGVKVLDGDECEIAGVGFAGVKGMGGGFGTRALQPWGKEVIKRFVREAVEEALKLESALAKLTSSQRVAVLHYSPIRETVEGEPPEVYPFLGSSRLEEPLLRYPVAVALHGHAHHGRLEGRTRSDVPVYNVCIPVLERLNLGHPPYWMVELDPAGSPSAVGRRLRAV